MSKQTNFNDSWLSDPVFSSWLGKDKDTTKARCFLCGGGSFSLDNMGKQALISHAKGKKHQQKVKLSESVKKEQDTFGSFFVKSQPESVAAPNPKLDAAVILNIPEPPPQAPETSKSKSKAATLMPQMVNKADVLNAEVLWALKILTSHYSQRSCEDTDKLFKNMFPDSQMAQNFQCGRTKCSYLICFGLAPYYHNMLLSKLKEPGTKFVISFDESLNKILQQEQMDMIVRFWDKTTHRVISRYLDSQFLGHTRATDLLKNFKIGLIGLHSANLLQVSMDGPATNWKFYDNLLEDRKQEDPNIPSLLNVGSCGLHVVHGGFQTGATATGWKLESLLRSVWYLFVDAPARREDYETITKSTVYPLHFCATCWLEDVPVAERAIQIWPDMVKYVTTVVAGPKSKVPNIQSFQTLKSNGQDPLVTAKLQFFISVAKILKPFLEKFQTDAPMMLFMAIELQTILNTILGKFIKTSVLDAATNITKLSKIDLMKKENLVNPKEEDTGFATKVLVQKAVDGGKVSPLQLLEFQNECITFCQKLASKLMERCPLQYPVVRYLTSLDPVFMVKDADAAVRCFIKLLETLINSKIKNAESCDALLSQYKSWLTDVVKYESDKFESYSPSKERLDKFMSDQLSNKPEYKELFEVITDMLILSHGQSCVERGFSLNKDVLGVNMDGDTLIAYRRALDGVKSEACPFEEPVTKTMLDECRHAHLRYTSNLEKKKGQAAATEKEVEKKKITDALQESRIKVSKLKKISEQLVAEADQLAADAEKKHKMDLLVKSNALRAKL